jgi:GTP pyrophosphokinase
VFDKKILWMKQVLDWLGKSKNASEFVETLKIDLFENEIIVFTPKGDPISLPERSTPIDFAFAVHSGLGNHCAKAKVNGAIQPLDHHLQSGDTIEILPQNNASPSRNWLNFVRTGKAKSKIRAALGIEVEPKPKEARKRHLADTAKGPLLFKYISIEGRRAPLKFSKCCEPKIGDEILGFYTKEGQITIHKVDCINVHSLDQSKKAVLKWVMPDDLNVKRLRISVNEKPHILVELLNILANNKITVHSVNSRTRKQRILLTFKIEGDAEKLSAVEALIKKTPDVLDITLENS